VERNSGGGCNTPRHTCWAIAATVAEARPKILQSICEILEWDLGAVWDVDPADLVLRCVEIWHSPEVDVVEFEEANTTTTYPLGQGLAGDVLAPWRAEMDCKPCR